MWKHDTIPPTTEKMGGMKPKIIVIVGATASGKTAFSIRLAEAVGGEIISADSRQIYRSLDLGTGKVTVDEARGIPHHLIDIRDAQETYSAAEFARDAHERIHEIRERGHMPIVCGGTFFYIEALLGRMSLPDVPPNEELRERLEMLDAEAVFAILESKDPTRARDIDRHNKRRVIRAIEIASALGSVPALTQEASAYEAFIVGIDMPKEVLHERIHTRLKERLDAGMLDEARQLHEAGLSYERMEELGLEYRFMARHLQGELTYEQMEELLGTEIRHFAKRQMTWLRKMEGVRWYAPTELDKAVVDAKAFLN